MFVNGVDFNKPPDLWSTTTAARLVSCPPSPPAALQAHSEWSRANARPGDANPRPATPTDFDDFSGPVQESRLAWCHARIQARWYRSKNARSRQRLRRLPTDMRRHGY